MFIWHRLSALACSVRDAELLSATPGRVRPASCMSQPSSPSNEGIRRLSRPSLASTQFGPRGSTVVRKSRIQSVLASAAAAAQAEVDPEVGATLPTTATAAMSDRGDDRSSNGSDGSAPDPPATPRLGPRQDSDGASVTENPAEASRVGAAKSAKKPPGPPSKAPAPPAAKKTSSTGTVSVTNALSSVPEGGGVSDWKKSPAASKAASSGKKLPNVKPANAGKRASVDSKKTPRTSVVPRRGGGGPANSPENMARSAAQKKRDREILKKRLKRRVFFMLWYGKAFTPAQVWGLRALMTLTVVSVFGVMLETMETSPDGNAFRTFVEPVSDANDPATVSNERSQAVVNALITLEIIVVVASLIEYAMRLWVCTISKRYVQQYDETSFWFRWGCCFRSCLYGEETLLMGAGDEEAALQLLRDKKRSVQSPLLPGAAGAMSAAKSASAGGAAGGGGGSAKLSPQELADQQALARKQGQSMDLKARLLRSRIPTKQELRVLRNKSRLMFALSTSSLMDVATMLPVLVYAMSGGAVDVFGVGSQNLLPAALRIIRLLRLTKFARYMEGIRLLVAVAVEKRTEMATGFLLCVMVAIVMSGGVFLVETSANPEQFIDFFSAVYYSVITLSTVGYGDKFPITQTGRILGGLGALMGIGLFTLPSSIITSGFEEKSEREYTSRRDGLDMIDIVQRRWELRQALSWWRYAARMQVMAEEHMLRKSALEVLREHRSNALLTEGDFDMDENDSGALDGADGNSEESKSGAVRGHRDSMATSMGGGLGDSVSVLGGLRGPPSPRGKQRRGSMGISVRSGALDAQSTLAISGMARTGLSEEEQLDAIMTQLKPLRSQTEERRLAKALQLLDVCNGDVGEALMILSEVMSGAAAAAIQVGDSRVGGNSSLKLKK